MTNPTPPIYSPLTIFLSRLSSLIYFPRFHSPPCVIKPPEQILPRIAGHPCVVLSSLVRNQNQSSSSSSTASSVRTTHGTTPKHVFLPLTAISVEIMAGETCERASQDGVLDGISAQGAAVAAMLFATASVLVANQRTYQKQIHASASSSSSRSVAIKSEPFDTPSSVTGQVMNEPGIVNARYLLFDLLFIVPSVTICSTTNTSIAFFYFSSI